MDKDIGNASHFSEEDLRFATPLNVADYRAERLKCKVIIELCSGIGIQSGAFAKTCRKVFGFEIDERKVGYSQENFKEFDNLKFFQGDVLSKEVVKQVKEICPDIIFCDPERLAAEKERNLNSIKPSIKRLIEIYSKITPNICIEVPPQIDLMKLSELGEFEAEYLSLSNKLNRLNLYFGDLKSSEISVTDVISRVRIEKDKGIRKPRKSNRIFRYLYEASSAIEKAGLENEFADELGALVLKGCEKGKLLLTSDKMYDGKLKTLCNIYELMSVAGKLEDVARILKEKGFGKVVIKYSVSPKEYWKERNRIENNLIGNKEKEAVLFSVEGKYVICRKVE